MVEVGWLWVCDGVCVGFELQFGVSAGVGLVVGEGSVLVAVMDVGWGVRFGVEM